MEQGVVGYLRLHIVIWTLRHLKFQNKTQEFGIVIQCRLNSKRFPKKILKPVFKKGKLVYTCPELKSIQEQVKKEMLQIHGGIKRFVNPHVYVVGLERNLYEKRLRLILEQRKLIS